MLHDRLVEAFIFQHTALRLAHQTHWYTLYGPSYSQEPVLSWRVGVKPLHRGIDVH